MLPLTLEQYETLWSKCEIPLAIISLDDSFVRCNRAFCNILGYSESELQRLKWTEITHPSDHAGDIASVAALRADNNSDGYGLTKRYITKDDHIIRVRLAVLPVRDTAEHLMGYFISVLLTAPDLPHPLPESFSLVRWATSNPKDTLIMALTGSLLLGRDAIIDLLKLWLSK